MRRKSKKEEVEEGIDIFIHEMVPKHRVLSEEEKEEVLKRYNAKLMDLPRILVSDPVVRRLGAKPGDVIEIIRKSPTAGESKYYRVVVIE